MLPQMKRYTEFGTEVLRRLDEGVLTHKSVAVVPVGVNSKKELSGEELKKDACRVLYLFDDANCLHLVRKGIERLGVPHLLDGL